MRLVTSGVGSLRSCDSCGRWTNWTCDTLTRGRAGMRTWQGTFEKVAKFAHNSPRQITPTKTALQAGLHTKYVLRSFLTLLFVLVFLLDSYIESGHELHLWKLQNILCSFLIRKLLMTLSLSYYPNKHSTITGSYAEECMNVKECRQRILNWKRSKSKRRSIVCISYVCSPHVFTLFLWRFLQRLKAYIHDFFLKPLNENVNSNFTTGSLDFNNFLNTFKEGSTFLFLAWMLIGQVWVGAEYKATKCRNTI